MKEINGNKRSYVKFSCFVRTSLQELLEELEEFQQVEYLKMFVFGSDKSS